MYFCVYLLSFGILFFSSWHWGTVRSRGLGYRSVEQRDYFCDVPNFRFEMVAQEGMVLTPALVRCGVCRLDAERWGVFVVAFF